ncbi:MAG: PHB depolymerase family esterase [Anaerolineales bacterium]|jgi:polyhydroxybutyrate depolymerase
MVAQNQGDNYTDEKDFPLVIYLHSYGWNAQKGLDYTQLNQVGNAYGFIILYPNANRNWNSGIGDNPVYSTPDIDDVGYISALIDAISEQYSIDQEMIYAAGYSNGGFMAYKLACQLSHRIAAIASVSGVFSTSVKDNCNPTRPVPVLHIHGTKDPWVTDQGGTGWYSVDQTLEYWIDFNKCESSETSDLLDIDSTDGSTVEKIYYSNCADDSNVIYYKVIGGGHTWPGAGPPGYSAGNTNQDINASEEI